MLRAAQDGQLCKVMFDFLEHVRAVICPSNRVGFPQHQEERSQFVCELGYETS